MICVQFLSFTFLQNKIFLHSKYIENLMKDFCVIIFVKKIHVPNLFVALKFEIKLLHEKT